MEAPEKIYLGIGPIGGDKPNEKYLYAEWDEEPKPMVKNIEYTRTDAFIEKAVKFLEDNLTEEDCKFGWSEWTEVKSGYNSIDSFARAFRKYMKGE